MQQPLQKDCSNIQQHQDLLHTSDVCSQHSDLRSAVQAWPRVLSTRCQLLSLFLESGSGALGPGPGGSRNPLPQGERRDSCERPARSAAHRVGLVWQGDLAGHQTRAAADLPKPTLAQALLYHVDGRPAQLHLRPQDTPALARHHS